MFDKHLYLPRSIWVIDYQPSFLGGAICSLITGICRVSSSYRLLDLSSLESSRIDMVLKLYGFPQPTSISVRIVAFVLREKEVPFEFIPIDYSKKEHKSPAYLEKQPFGQVPYIVCDVLWIYPMARREYPTQCSLRLGLVFPPGWWRFHTLRKQGYLLLYRRKVP